MGYRNALGLVMLAAFFAASPAALAGEQASKAEEQPNPNRQGSAVIDETNANEAAEQDGADSFDEGLEETEQPIRPGQMEQDAASEVEEPGAGQPDQGRQASDGDE